MDAGSVWNAPVHISFLSTLKSALRIMSLAEQSKQKTPLQAMISTQIAIRCELIRTGSKPSREKSTDVQNHFRLVIRYHQSL